MGIKQSFTSVTTPPVNIITALPYEILLIIFRILARVVNGKKYLAMAARVCKAFMEPTLDVLWYTIEDLNQLLYLLPTDCIKLSYTLKHSRVLRKPAEKELNRLRFYTARIREFSKIKESNDFVPLLPDTALTWVIFPNVIKVTVWCMDNVPVKFLRRIAELCGTRIVSLGFRNVSLAKINSDNGSFVSLFSAWALCNTEHLRSLEFRLMLKDFHYFVSPEDLNKHGQPLSTTLSRIVQGCQKLTSVRILAPLTSPQLVSDLSRLPHLMTLDIAPWDIDLSISLPKEPQIQDPFPALERLTLDFCSRVMPYHSRRSILRGRDCFARKAIVIRAADTLLTNEDIADIFGTLIHPLISLSLEEMHLDLQRYSLYQFATFRPLLQMPRLRILEISSFVQMVNDDLCDIARAWPRLHTLTFSNRMPRNNGERVSPTSLPDLEGLSQFSRCAHLTYLVLYIHIKELPFGSDQLPPSLAMNLTGLVLGDSICSREPRPALIANFLLKVFPRLQNIWFDVSLGQGWDEVRGHLIRDSVGLEPRQR